MMPFLYRNFIDGQIPEVFEHRPGELLLEVPFLNVLDDIPGDVEMAGHVEDRHVLRELEDVALESPGIGEAGIGKAKFYLADYLAAFTRNPLYVEVQIDHLRSYGHHAEPSR